MKEDQETSGVIAALRQWAQTATKPKLKPLWGKSRELRETALRTASSFKRRCEVYIRRSEQDTYGLIDQRRLRAAAALSRICRAMVSDCEEFFASAEGAPLSKLDSSLAKLCDRVKTNYNESGRLIVGIYGSENSSLKMEIESLQQVKNQVSIFQSRNRETMKSQALIEELVTSLAEHLDSIDGLKASRTQIEKEIRELNLGIGSIESVISEIEADPEVISLDTNQRELKNLRRELLDQKISRLRGPLSRFLSVSKEGLNAPEAVETLSKYMRAPLTSLARESDGYPGLKEVLLALQKAIETGQVGLDRKKALKTLERIRQILGGSLLSLQKDARRTVETRKELLRSQTVRQLQSRRAHLKLEHDSLVDSRKLLEARTSRLSEETSSKRGQLEGCLGRIEKLVNNDFGKNLPSDLRDRILLLGRG